MANYTVTTTYKTLASIMGTDYDATKDYTIHVNEITRGILQVNASNTGRGKEYKSFSEINITKGTTMYFKGTADTISIYVESKTQA